MPTSRKIPFLICASPRSGSSLLYDLMKNTGICCEKIGSSGSELLLRENIERMDNDWEKIDLKLFFQQLFKATMVSTGGMGFKVMWGQFVYLSEIISKTERYHDFMVEDFIHYLPDGIKFIWVTRRDKAEQAVSLEIAKITKSWTSFKKPIPVAHMNFHYQNVTQSLQDILCFDWGWKNFFWVNQINPLQLEYEKIIDDYEGALKTVFRFLEIRPPQKLQIITELRKQGNSVNDQWVEKFRERMPLFQHLDVQYSFPHC